MTNSQKPIVWKGKFICPLVVIFVVIIAGIEFVSAQSFPRESWPFTINEKALIHPLAGGLNAPQVSAVDLNGDGRQDLHVFDRVGNKQLAFLNDGSRQDYPYHFAPEWLAHFPYIEQWMLLRDYNGDGIMDIFAYSDRAYDAVMVFTGYHRQDTLAFRRVPFDNADKVIRIPRPGGNSTQLFVSAIDYPAIDDLDCDGDLDVLTFNSVGGYVELYANQSVEMGFGLDSLIFRLVDNCWGGFFESGISNAVTLADQAGDCVNRLTEGNLEVRHAGSTLLTFDADGDGDKDLLLGDISFDQLNLLTNGGDCEQAWINDQQIAFPANDVPVDVPVFPAAYYLDVDNDQHNDLLVAPNSAVGGLTYDVLWYYRNVGTAERPAFRLQRSDFLIDEMIDLGSGAHPVIVDYNADGLLDLVVGNNTFYEPLGAKNSRLFLFENTGTTDQPAFTLVDDDFLSLNQFSQSAYSFAPAFGDLDADGDQDALIGEQNGRLFFAENVAGPGQVFEFAPARYSYMDINVGQAAVPQIIDLNRDGLPDLIVGERNGNINYFQNQGTARQAFFDPDPASSPNVEVLGQIDTRSIGFTTGYSTPVIVEVEGEQLLITGTELGNIELYAVNPSQPSALFQVLDAQYGQLRVGERSYPALGDLDSDGLLEVIIGNLSGGLTAYQTDLPASPPVATSGSSDRQAEWQLFPNPAKDIFSILIPTALRAAYLEVWNTQGQRILSAPLYAEKQQWSVASWPSGIYWVRIVGRSYASTRKLIVE